jgi:hypothetical protein
MSEQYCEQERPNPSARHPFPSCASLLSSAAQHAVVYLVVRPLHHTNVALP